MILYVSITIWMFAIMIIGLRPDSQIVADLWPDKPTSGIPKTNLKVCNSLAVITLLFFWFLTAFRAENIGNDTSTYIYYFKIFSNGGIDKSRTFELGYQYLNVLIGKLTTDPHIFLIIIASIMYLGTGIYLFKYSKNILLSLCLFYCVFFSIYTSMFRQGIAMIIVVYAYELLKEKKRIFAALLFVLATLFHTSAIVCFLLFLNTRLLKKRWVVLLITAICGLLSISGVFNTVISMVVPRYSHYFMSRYASTGWLAVSYDVIRNLIWFWLGSKAVDISDQDNQLAVTDLTFLLIFGAFGYSVNLFTRAGEYFLIIAITELPNLLYTKSIKHHRIWMFCICTVMLIMFILTLIYRPGWNHLYPYELWR